MEAGPSDRGTSRLIVWGFLFMLTSGVLAPVLSRFGWGKTSGSRLAVLGQGMMVAGLGCKLWTMQTLGRFYTRTLRVADDQTIIQSGPYRLARHPGYLGTLLVWGGFGWATGNWPVGVSNALVLALVYGRRIAVEEAMLLERFGEPYETDRRGTWRLVPGML